MKIAISSMRYALLFCALSALMLANGSAPSTGVITLFAVGELGATGILCSIIVRQYRRRAMAEPVMAALAGYSISHIGILTLMFFGLVGSASANAPGQSTLLWMELTLRVGLVVVLTSAGFVSLKPVLRKASLSRLQKLTESAGDYVI